MKKEYSILITNYRTMRAREKKGTLGELINYFSYTLQTGQSYEYEKGNKKINTNPKSIKSLVNNLNNAVTNAAANGCPSEYFEIV